MLPLHGFALDPLRNRTFVSVGAASALWWLVFVTCTLVVTWVAWLRLHSIDTWLVGDALLAIIVLQSSLDCILVLHTHDFFIGTLLHKVVKLAARMLRRRNISAVNSLNIGYLVLLMFSEHLAEALRLLVLLPQSLLERQRSWQVSLGLVLLAGALRLRDGHDTITVLLTQVIHVFVRSWNVSKVCLTRDPLFSELLHALGKRAIAVQVVSRLVNILILDSAD